MPVDVTAQYVRIRQVDPGEFQEGSFRTITLDAAKGIRAVIGKLKGKTTTTVQTYLFDRDKGWDTTKAQAWVAKHKGGHRTKAWAARASGYEGDVDLLVEIKGASHFQLTALDEEEQCIAAAGGATIVLNSKGVAHAKSLIRAGHVKNDAAWKPSASQMNRILGKPPNWKRYGSWHLAINTNAKEATKDRYRFPFGDGSDVFRRALGAAAQRASQFDYPKIQDAASSLIELIKKEEGEAQVSAGTPVRLLEFFAASSLVEKGDHVELDAEGVPTAFRIVPMGAWSTNKYGTLNVDTVSARVVMAWYEHRGMKKLPIDYDHKTFEPSAPNAPAAGWYALEVRKDGIWATDLEWDPEARDHLKAKRYRHFSPTGHYKDGRLLTLDTIALTNIPDTNNQLPLVATAAPDGGEYQPPETGEVEMEELLKLLGLTPENTEDDAIAKFKEFQAKAKETEDAVKTKDEEIAKLKKSLDDKDESEELTALKSFHASTIEVCGLDDKAKPEDVKAYVGTLKAQEPDKARLGELESEVKTLKANAEETRVRDIMAEYKVKQTPANKDIMEDLARTLDADKFKATMGQWPDVQATSPAGASTTTLTERNDDITADPVLEDCDREFFKVQRWDPKTDEGKREIADYIAAKKD